jgi:hypothetical protein
MLHARTRGETFGLAVAEFAAHGKPVITSSVHHDGGFARFHIDTLGERGCFYQDHASLVRLLTQFDRSDARAKGAEHWRAPYAPFEPHAVMRAFRTTFLSGWRRPQLRDADSRAPSEEAQTETVASASEAVSVT